MPDVSVVVNTFNRAPQVSRAIESVLSQPRVDLELVVVDDGSTDDTQAVLATLTDPRMRCMRQANRGLSASRNVGAREARGDWLLFLDDDDRLCEGALEALLAAATDPPCRVVMGGVRFVDGNGQVLRERVSLPLAEALAGTFLISRSLFHEAGGYLEGLPCSHQTELFMRVRRVLADGAGTASFVTRPVVEVELRPSTGRPQRTPANIYFGGRWIAVRHPDQYENRRARAAIQTIAAVNAMRIGRKGDARRRFASAVRHDPLSPGRYLRLGAAIASPIGRRIWLRQWDAVPEAQRSLDRVRKPADRDGSPGMPALERDPCPGPDSLFLPWRYLENSPEQQGLERNDSHDHGPFYKLAARLARAERLAPVVDIGAASAHNFAVLDDEAFWNQVADPKPQLVICSNMVEHVPDPRRLLSGIRHAIGDGGLALIATPDRHRLQPESAMGPPSDPHRIREWSAEEFAMLLESCRFEILRMVHRRRTSMAFIVRAATV